MKQMKHIWHLGAALLLLTAAASSCESYIEDRMEEQGTMPLTLYLQAPDHHKTRAYEGDIAGRPAENAVNTVKVWIYDHTDGTFLDFAETTASTVTLNLPRYIVTGNRSIDVYAIANAATVGLEGLNAESGQDKAQLAQQVIGGTAFTPASQTWYSYINDNGGVPMSCIQTVGGFTLSGNTVVSETLPKIQLARAVSKVRFVFSRSYGQDQVEITGVQIDGGQFPTKQLIFPNPATENFQAPWIGDKLPNLAADNTFDTAPLLYGSSATTGTVAALLSATDMNNRIYGVAQGEDPAALEFQSTGNETETGVEYETRLNTAIASDKATEFRLTYLRETGKKLTGRIFYRLAPTAPIQEAPFELADANDFARNHTWTVYAYFKARKLEVKPIVDKWEWEDDHQLELDSKGEILISILGDEGRQSYRVFNPTPILGSTFPANINWNNAYVGIYYGRESDENDPLYGQPLYSPLLHLRTKFSLPLTLKNNNANFGFVKVTIGEHGARTYEPGFTGTPLTEITIPAWTEAAYGDNYIDTYFCVVPMTQRADVTDISDAEFLARDSHLYLLDPDGYKQPINPSFMPGPNNNEIWFFYMGSFAAYDDLEEYNTSYD